MSELRAWCNGYEVVAARSAEEAASRPARLGKPGYLWSVEQ